jgi:hypothetical protein
VIYQLFEFSINTNKAVMKKIYVNLIIVAATILIALAIIFKEEIFKIEERRIINAYQPLKDKTIFEMTESEWIIHNKYQAIEAKRKNQHPDTFPYDVAKSMAELSAKMAYALSPCNEHNMLDGFHRIMEFNYPYYVYDKEKVNYQLYSDCTMRVSLTAREPHSYNWKTYFVFEVYYDGDRDVYELRLIDRKFLG